MRRGEARRGGNEAKCRETDQRTGLCPELDLVCGLGGRSEDRVKTNTGFAFFVVKGPGGEGVSGEGGIKPPAHTREGKKGNGKEDME